VVVALALGLACGAAVGQGAKLEQNAKWGSPQGTGLKPEADAAVDSDQDGMSDAVEQALLVQFAPTFVVGRHDCAGVPAEFEPGVAVPTAAAEDGTIYGQVTPFKVSGVGGAGAGVAAEIHFYHLWSRDCGPHGHKLDAEHVAVLVTGPVSGPVTSQATAAMTEEAAGATTAAGTGPAGDAAGARWKAVYWYAAAHEKTVCDVSQITRASTVHAEESGARVWISPGKHASYLNEALCQAGCGADRCADMTALPRGRIVNLGEAGHAMNGSAFIASGAWPLGAKMTTSNFPPEALARLNQMPASDIAWFNAGRHPAQGIIAESSATEQAIAGGAGATTDSLARAGDSTSVAISVAQDDTGNALGKSYRRTVHGVGHGLGAAARGVGQALGVSRKAEKTK
jgi:hypothetical protein